MDGAVCIPTFECNPMKQNTQIDVFVRFDDCQLKATIKEKYSAREYDIG